MNDHSNRVSQQGLADAIAAAVALEEQRIEQIGAESIANVSGGFVPLGGDKFPMFPGTTMGIFPRPDDFLA